jgi:RimJ/RimL family protein N-acetyltransferase
MEPEIKYLGSKVEISTQRLVLRQAKEEDAEALYEVLHDPIVMQYW